MGTTTYKVGVRIEGDASGLGRAAKEAQEHTKRMGGAMGQDFAKLAKARELLGVRSEHQVQREIQKTEAAYNRLSRSGTLSAAEQARAAKAMQAEVKKLNQEMGKTGVKPGDNLQEFSKMAKARELLGVRPEREIQREIQRTEAAYARLARSGTMSFYEQRAAAKATREEVTRLTNEMGRLTTRQKLTRGFAVAGGLAAAGGVAAAMAVPKVEKALAYDVRLAHLANTAFNDRDQAGRRSGRRELDADITDAVRYGRGTRDNALDTAEKLYGAGIFKPVDIKTILRESLMAATANNAESASFAQMAISANQTMGIKPEQMGRMFGMGTFAGQSGGFEIKDMAKWLPQQMAAAKAVGMYGETGFAKLAALNQASVVTAGTKDEAGNNVVNLLAKMGSQDTNKDFKKLGINLPQELAQGRMKGLDALDVVGGLLESQLGKDKNYQRVQKELAAAKGDADRTKALSAVGDIAQGTVIGKVFQDRQALMALYAYMNGRERVKTISDGALANPDAAQKNFALISETASSKVEQASNEREISMQRTMDKFLPAIGSMADGVTNLMRQYPGYTTAIIGATAAVAALAGSAAFAALALRRGGGGLDIPGLPGGGGAGKAGAPVGKAGGMMRGMGKVGGLVGAGLMLTDLFMTSPEEIAILEAADARKKGGGGSGIRGQGFNDPRLLGGAKDGANAAAFEQSLRATEVKGEIFVRVSAAPGLNIQAETKGPSSGVQMRADVGRTMMNAGH